MMAVVSCSAVTSAVLGLTYPTIDDLDPAVRGRSLAQASVECLRGVHQHGRDDHPPRARARENNEKNKPNFRSN